MSIVPANREPNSPFFLVNEMAGPKVSFIQRLRCMLPDARRNPPLEDDSIWNNIKDFGETIARYNHLQEVLKRGCPSC